MKPTIHPLVSADIPIIAGAFLAVGWYDRTETLQRYVVEQQRGQRAILVAEVEGTFAGYGTVLWASPYPPFAEKGIPEISDLNVVPTLRRQGIASAILDEAERMVFSRSPVVGIGVGMFSDYGAAQRLYAKRGYVPDGLGLFYEGANVKEGQLVRVGHDLVLYMTKGADH